MKKFFSWKKNCDIAKQPTESNNFNKMLNCQIVTSGTKGVLLVQSPKFTSSKKGHYIIVCDNSGSMNAEAPLKTKEGGTECYGWSYLDIAKHACTTVSSSLTEGDIVTFISYSERAKTHLKHLVCTAANKSHCIDVIYNNVFADASTNFSAALEEVKAAVDTCTANVEHTQILFFTDGHPTERRDSEFVQFKDDIRKSFSNTFFTCFAVGNSIDSKLLYNMGHGFLHISDPSMVGETLCNVLATMKLCIEWTVFEMKDVVFDDSGTNTVRSMIRFGEEKAFTFTFSGNPLNNVVFPMRSVSREEWDQKFGLHEERSTVVRKIRQFLTNTITSSQFESMSSTLKDPNLYDSVHSEIYVKGIAKNAQWYTHALRCISYALLDKVCVDFRTKASMTFASAGQKELAEEIELVFATKKPPTPSLSGSQVRPLDRLPDQFVRGGGCFYPMSKLWKKTTSGYQQVPICHLKKGDVVLSADMSNGGVNFVLDTVECVVEHIYSKPMNIFMLDSSLGLTATHPVWMNGEFIHPFSSDWTTMSSMNVFNLVMKGRHCVIAGSNISLPVVTLGHNYTGDIVSHDYFGTNLVIDDLKQESSYKTGFVSFQEDIFPRKNQEKCLIPAQLQVMTIN